MHRHLPGTDHADPQSLNLKADPGLQSRIWGFQRAGWIFLLLFTTAAVLGLFGPGVFNHGQAVSADGSVRIDYPRFWRLGKPMTVRLHVPRPGETGTGGEVRVWLDRHYLEAMSLQQVSPRPRAVEAGGDRHVFVIVLADGSPEATVSFEFRPQQFGTAHLGAGRAGGPALSVRQFIHP